MYKQYNQQTGALGADSLDPARHSVTAARISRDVDAIFGLRVKPDDGGRVERPVHRVVDAGAWSRHVLLVAVARARVVDLVAADDAVQLVVSGRLPLNAQRRRVDRFHPHSARLSRYCSKKGKVFPYSLPSVGPGANPGVQAVSLQVT